MANIEINDLPIKPIPVDSDELEIQETGGSVSLKTTRGGLLGVGSVTQAYSAVLDGTTASFTAGEETKLAGIEAGATADQTDSEIATAYGNIVPQVTSQEKIDGTEAALRTFSPKDVADMSASGGTGEANTGSNQGTVGVGVYDTKAGIDLQFRNIGSGSTKVTTTLSGKNILVDVVPAQIDITQLLNAGALAAKDIVATADITDNAVTDAKLAQIATGNLKGRVSTGTGNVEVLNPATVRTLLNVADGADVTDATNVAAAGATMDADTSLVGNGYFLDEDTLVSDDATKVPSQSSVKAYVDNHAVIESLIVAASDEITDLLVAGGVTTFRMPYGFNLTALRASVTTAPTGTALVADLKMNGVSVLSTLVSIDIGEKTSVTAAAPPVISNNALTDDAEMTIDITQIGSTIAGTGLKITLIGNRTV